MARRPPSTHGLAVVDKPAGVTSHDVVAMLRRRFSERQVGHAGTLDPDATGILLVGVGKCTRLLRFLTALGKTYTATVVLGTSTSTLDAAGEVTGTWDMTGVTPDQRSCLQWPSASRMRLTCSDSSSRSCVHSASKASWLSLRLEAGIGMK